MKRAKHKGMVFFTRIGLPESFANEAGQQATMPAPPKALVERAQTLARAVKLPEEARLALDEITVHLPNFRLSQELCLACGTLLEKLRAKAEMLETWRDIHELFPSEPLPLRMMMRWYRRTSLTTEGLDHLKKLSVEWSKSPKDAEKVILGHMELQVFEELDTVMVHLLERYPKNDRLRFLYIKSLTGQGRINRAQRVLDEMTDFSRLGPNAMADLDALRATASAASNQEQSTSIIEALLKPFICRTISSTPEDVLGQVVFFTGQLGAGGAERQMTRIAAAFQRMFVSGQKVGGDVILGAPPMACVKDTTASEGKDFFLPVLQEAQIDTTVLNELDVPNAASLGLTTQQRALFDLLPKDIKVTTCQLTAYLRQRDVQVLYMWQDGAVLGGALAGLLAGVPRLVASFRGLPPNIRTELMRPEYYDHYRTLSNMPGVSFTANSRVSANAYEDWLGLTRDSIHVIHNAVPDLAANGSEADEAAWNKIKAASAECRKTVIGIFRFDHNKRPSFWINTAVSYCRAHDDTRFIIVGKGDELDDCRQRVKKLGLENRIFLVGPSSCVGYWLHKSDMLLHLARFEGLPNVVIEAQLVGLPVLATPAGGTSDIVVHEVTGHVLDDAAAPDVDAIQAQLSRILNDTALRQMWGTAAKEIARPKFSLDHAVEQTVTLFRGEQLK